MFGVHHTRSDMARCAPKSGALGYLLCSMGWVFAMGKKCLGARKQRQPSRGQTRLRASKCNHLAGKRNFPRANTNCNTPLWIDPKITDLRRAPIGALIGWFSAGISGIVKRKTDGALQ